MAMSFNSSQGGWIADSVQKDGSSSQNGYGFYIGVKENYVSGGADNYSNISIQIAIVNSNYRFATGGWKFRYTIDGSVKNVEDGVTIHSTVVAAHETVRPITFDNSGNTIMNVNNIPHNSDGSKTISIKVEMYKDRYLEFDPGYCVVDTTFELTKIARYAEITNFTVSKIDETSVRFHWNASQPCDFTWYSVDGGSNWTPLPIDNIVGGLSAGTGYNFKLRVRSAEGQLVSESGTVYQETYDYPKPTEISDFVIGNAISVNVYNPLGRTYNLELISNNDGSIIGTYEGSINGYLNGFNDSSSVNKQYTSIPNSKSGTCYAKVTYETYVKNSNNATYSIKGDEIPIFDDFLYKDVDSVQTLVNNNQILVAGYSDCLFTMLHNVRAIARAGASIIKYLVCWGDSSIELPYSDTEDVTGYLYDQSSSLLKVIAVDSRGLTKEVSKIVPIVPYSNAVITNVATEREDGINQKTFLSFSVSIADINWNLSNDEDYQNRLKYVTYRVKDGSSWGEYQDYNLLDTIEDKLRVTKTNGRIIYTLDFNDEVEIHANGQNNGFEVGKEYTIELLMKDGNQNVTSFMNQFVPTAQAHVTDGKVGMSRYKDYNGDYHYGFNGMPDSKYNFKFNGNINPDLRIGDTNVYLANLDCGVGKICKIISNQDLNTACGNATGFYMGSGMSHAPSFEWHYIIHIVHNELYKKQIAFNFFNHEIYERSLTDGVWTDWKIITSNATLCPYVLYDNGAGTTGSTTLSGNVNEFEYLDIQYYVMGFECWQRIPVREGYFHLEYTESDDNSLRLFRTEYIGQGNGLTPTNHYYAWGSMDSFGRINDVNYITIRKVIGYK